MSTKNLAAIEWLKIKRYRTFWILVLFFVVLMPLWNYEISDGLIKMGSGDLNILNRAYSFPEVWANLGFWGSIFIVFPAILIMILTTNEYGFRTHRQNVIDGWTRMQFYHAKVMLVVLFSVGATVFLFLLGVIFGLMNGGAATEIFTQGEQILYFFLLSLNYMGFALFIAIWIKRSGLAIGIFLLYCLILENILKGILNWKFDFKPGNYLPLQASDELLPFPFMKMALTMMKQDAPPMTSYAIVTVAWCLIYYFAGRTMLSRSDW